MNRSEYRDRLNGLAGLDIAEPVINPLIEEGRRTLVCRSEWRRANIPLGPTVADQEAYALPATVHRVRKLKVNGIPFQLTSEEQVDELKQNWKWLRCAGLYWMSFDEDAAESISLYPLPTTDGLSVIGLCAIIPNPLPDDDTEDTAIPAEYQQGVVDYVASLAYGFQEDNPELRSFHEDEFNNAVAGLRRLRTAKAHAGPVQVRVVGMT